MKINLANHTSQWDLAEAFFKLVKRQWGSTNATSLCLIDLGLLSTLGFSHFPTRGSKRGSVCVKESSMCKLLELWHNFASCSQCSNSCKGN